MDNEPRRDRWCALPRTTATGGSATPTNCPPTVRTRTDHPSELRSPASARGSWNTFTTRHRLPSSTKTTLPPGTRAAATVSQNPTSRAGGTWDSQKAKNTVS
ncbi:hypothetical protein [Streptomyces niveus]|uniref:hypothetical protein n=1 Tax=Streptomyces niveus TaxID=193462 RepID=UPI003F5400B4